MERKEEDWRQARGRERVERNWEKKRGKPRGDLCLDPESTKKIPDQGKQERERTKNGYKKIVK